MLDKVTFWINDTKYEVGCEVMPNTSLGIYLRRYLNLRGTKLMCHEGGCGCCIVSVKKINFRTQEFEVLSVNSPGGDGFSCCFLGCSSCSTNLYVHVSGCKFTLYGRNSGINHQTRQHKPLSKVSVLSCHGWNITTIESLGNRRKGYHPIQERLASFGGSQCGYCSPGFVMSMYSLYQNNNKRITAKQVENAFGSNICRCTGYRPILDAFKSFSTDWADRLSDIEDLNKISMCAKTGEVCTKTCADYDHEKEWCMINMETTNESLISKSEIIKISMKEHTWYKVYKTSDILQLFETEVMESYTLLAGNTAHGIYPIFEYPKIIIDISDVDELKEYYIDQNLVLGANITLTDTMNIFLEISEHEEFWYLKKMYNHMQRVAHIPVRNIGTLAGNLSTKHKHRRFQSDMFILFEAAGATITIVNSKGRKKEMSPLQFLDQDLKGKLILNIKLPPLSRDYLFDHYKISTVVQNDLATVNAAFLFEMDKTRTVVNKASIVYGGINALFTHAFNTEEFLKNKKLFNNTTLQEALKVLQNEVVSDEHPAEPKSEARNKLVLGLFYKCILRLAPKELISNKLKSGAEKFNRPISRGEQKFETDKSQYPNTQAIPKLDSILQCSGEAAYSDDTPSFPDEVFAALVTSTITSGTIEHIDPSEALSKEGVLGCYTAKDIPGMNSHTPLSIDLYREIEELLAEKKIPYYGKPLAVIAATSQELANNAAMLVKVAYNQSNEYIALNIDEARKAPKEQKRIRIYPGFERTSQGTNVKKIVSGRCDHGTQYAFTMEPQLCVTRPVDDSFEVYSSTQFLDAVQVTLGNMLKIPQNRIRVVTRRCGGAYGAKVTIPSIVAGACTLVAAKLNRPCRLTVPIKTMLGCFGKRHPYMMEYKAGVDENGKIQYLDLFSYIDNGVVPNEYIDIYIADAVKNCYDFSTWKLENYVVLTNNPTNTFVRAPGSLNAITAIENIMDHIARETKRDPFEVRLTNMRKENNDIPELMPMFKEDTDYENRLKNVKIFNSENRWKKRCLYLTNMAYPIVYLGGYVTLVSVYHDDGSVAVTTGGIEIGQGINTKIIQIVASVLEIPLDKINIMPAYNALVPNSYAVGTSITSECCAYAAQKSCEIILERLKPFRAKMPNATFQEVAQAAYLAGILLQASYNASPAESNAKPYNAYGLCLIEVEVDILTGDHIILRADLLEDTGESNNPSIDIGQVEGAFMQGLGFFTSEEIKSDKRTGKVFTDSTRYYKVPGALDIPVDLRVKLRYHSKNGRGLLRSKAVGEPPLCLSVAVNLAIQWAVAYSRLDSGYDITSFKLEKPSNNANIILGANVNIKEFVLKTQH